MPKIVLYIWYVIYNLVLSVIALWVLLYLSMYINGFFIPNRDRIRIEMPFVYSVLLFILVSLEGIILCTLIYRYINMRYLKNKVSTNNGKSIALYTSIVCELLIGASFFFEFFLGK